MSTLKVNTITDINGGSSSLSVPGAAKAWVNFNGTGTVAIRAAMNVSSITDNGVGDYTVNFSTAMPDANYSVGVSGSGSADETNRAFGEVIPSVFATGSFKVRTGYSVGTSTPFDFVYVCCEIFR